MASAKLKAFLANDKEPTDITLASTNQLAQTSKLPHACRYVGATPQSRGHDQHESIRFDSDRQMLCAIHFLDFACISYVHSHAQPGSPVHQVPIFGKRVVERSLLFEKTARSLNLLKHSRLGISRSCNLSIGSLVYTPSVASLILNYARNTEKD